MYKFILPIALATAISAPAFALQLSYTDFEGLSTGVSVDGQAGWGVSGSFDEGVVDDGTGNTVWRVSNAVTSGAFGNQPFAPRPGGFPDGVTDPTNSNPGLFAGESSTGALNNRFFAEFDVRSATGSAQTGLSVTVSADNGLGGRQSFFDIEDSGSGIDVITYDLTAGGGFVGPITIQTGLNYRDYHTLAVEILFSDGLNNDVVNYFVNGSLVHTGQSWEEFYRATQAALHPSGVPVQTLLYRISGTEVPGVDGGGYFIDNVLTEVTSTTVPEPATLALMGLGLAGLGFSRRKKA